MNRRAFFNGAAWEPRQPAPRALRLSRFVPDFVGGTASQAGAPQSASRLGYRSAQQAQPSAPFLMIGGAWSPTSPADVFTYE